MNSVDKVCNGGRTWESWIRWCPWNWSACNGGCRYKVRNRFRVRSFGLPKTIATTDYNFPIIANFRHFFFLLNKKRLQVENDDRLMFNL